MSSIVRNKVRKSAKAAKADQHRNLLAIEAGRRLHAHASRWKVRPDGSAVGFGYLVDDKEGAEPRAFIGKVWPDP